MKKARLSTALTAAVLLTGLSLNLYSQEAWHSPAGTTYIVTNTDSATGTFVSRSLISFYADHHLAVVDSGQGGTACSSTPSPSSPCPSGAFSSQLGGWRDSKGTLTGRTLDFDFPPPDNDLFRLDWTFTLGHDGRSISGTVTLSSFPLTADPNEGSGTFIAKYDFTGYAVKVP